MDVQPKKERMKAWLRSEEYALKYTQFLSVAESLCSLAQQKLPEIEAISETFFAQTAHTEAATNSGLHRGYYCPSLIYDLIVGGVKRGRLLKKLTARSKSYFLYGFDDRNRLIWSKHFINNYRVQTEYFLHTDESIYGFTVDAKGRLEIITEEVYEDNRLVCYRHVLAVSSENGVEPVQMMQEEYTYDNEGLLCCDWYSLHPGIYLLKHEKVTFTRKDGYLAQYCVDLLIGSEGQEVFKSGDVFDSLVERKA